MKLFTCPNCYHPAYFENTLCLQCGSTLGFQPYLMELNSYQPASGLWLSSAGKLESLKYCTNHQFATCNWLVTAQDSGNLCRACTLNKTIPDLSNQANLTAWQEIEIARHRLIYSLLRLNLPLVGKKGNSFQGLAFNLVADGPGVLETTTGHKDGLITINIKEANSVHREDMRHKLGEPYRTVIGHFRHEIGHYYWSLLVASDPDILAQFRQAFGNDTLDYAQAMNNYYNLGPSVDWQNRHISAYASAHPWEDWAESWAHYLHSVDALETAYAFGLTLRPPFVYNDSLNMKATFDPYTEKNFKKIVDAYLPLTYAVNSINRSMGLNDLYPFATPPAVIEKLNFIHRLIHHQIK